MRTALEGRSRRGILWPTVSDIPPSLQAALAERYSLEQVIGQGGMATVYAARDLKHPRRVAVKILRPELGATLASQRFLHEIGIAAQLQHPHILTLIDSGEVTAAGAAGPYLYYVMPLVEGGSLRARLDREGTLPAADVVQVITEVADALSYAHRRKLIHRDVKPENILYAAGHAVVADFGLARALTEAAGPNLSRTGYPVGTVGYMSPEQAAGETGLDRRTDVFSLACVAYEMLVGEPPRRWLSDEARRQGRLLDAPPAHRQRLDALPGGVEQALAAALATRPDDRLATPADFAAALSAAFGPRPRFSENRALEILNRAVDLEARTGGPDENLSLAGIERIAAEVGVAPEHVRKAAHDLSRPRPAPAPATSRLLGGPTQVLVERVVEGELPEVEYATLVEEMHRSLGTVGQASTLGRGSLTWRTSSPPGHQGVDAMVTVGVREGITRLRLEERTQVARGVGHVVGGVFGIGLVSAMFIGLRVFHSDAAVWLGAVSSLVGSCLLVRPLYRRAFRRRRAQYEEVADRLATLAGELSLAGGPEPKQLPPFNRGRDRGSGS
jgi:serine/threonine protein kinase